MRARTVRRRARAAARAGRCRAGIGGVGEGMGRGKTLETLAPRLSTFHPKTRVQTMWQAAVTASCYLFCGHRIPVIYSANHPLLISLFVLDFSAQQGLPVGPRPCPIIPQDGGMLAARSPKASINHGAIKTQANSAMQHSRNSQPRSTIHKHVHAALCQPQCTLLLCLPLVCPTHLLAASGGPHPVGLS